MIQPDDDYFMKAALLEAKQAYEEDEIPVGAVIVCNQRIIARGHNMTETLNDVTAHAEILAITSAANFLGSKYLNDCTLYVTLEPCAMCAGALFWSQISRVVYGAEDDKRGFTKVNTHMLHPKTEIKAGVMAVECSRLLMDYFSAKRK
ncbi:MAG: nucleoside deaminase [Bacteroidia bacterium]|nr:nucleoside deaminase [Bacteroidia bacterium]